MTIEAFGGASALESTGVRKNKALQFHRGDRTLQFHIKCVGLVICTANNCFERSKALGTLASWRSVPALDTCLTLRRCKMLTF